MPGFSGTGGGASNGAGGGSSAEDFTVFSIASCTRRPDGVVCPGSDDPRQAERCFERRCVGTYAIPNGGSDANPGTRTQPKATLTAAFEVAARLAELDTMPKPVGVYAGAGTFAEDLDVPDQTDLQGGFDPTTWMREVAAHGTRLTPLDPRGIRFSQPSMTPETARMSGFVVLGASSGNDTAALTVENGARPNLEYLEIIGGVSSALSVAVEVHGGQSRPIISSCGLTGGAGAISAGLRISGDASVELARSWATGGTATQTSSGATCVAGCSTSSFVDVALGGGAAPESQGLWLQSGNNSGVFVSGASIHGTGLGAMLISKAVGVRISGPCVGTPPTVLGSSIAGAIDSNHQAIGVEVDDCSIDLRGSVVGGTTTGAVEVGAAVLCSGTASSCTLIDNELWAARAGAEIRDTAIGVRIAGTGHVGGNFISAGKCVSIVGGEATGLSLSTAAIRVENNVVLGGQCETSAALAVRTLGGGSGEPEIVNNHLEGRGHSNGFSAGVLLEQPRGVFLNNTIIAGIGVDGAAFYERETQSDPSALRHNNLIGNILYVDDGVPIRRIADVNGMSLGPSASGNISADPQVGTDYRLGPTSPNRGAGALSAGSVLAPAQDARGNPRAFPAGTNPDIGPDERD